GLPGQLEGRQRLRQRRVRLRADRVDGPGAGLALLVGVAGVDDGRGQLVGALVEVDGAEVEGARVAARVDGLAVQRPLHLEDPVARVGGLDVHDLVAADGPTGRRGAGEGQLH